MYHLAVRRSDVYRIGPKNVDGDEISFVQDKTDFEVVLPFPSNWRRSSPHLRSAKAPSLLTSRGKPFASAAGFGNWFGDRWDEAGLSHCSAHGIRHHVGNDLAGKGASTSLISAALGQKSQKSAAPYIKRANKKRMARDAMKLSGNGSGNVSDPSVESYPK
jgi:integrase